MNNNKKNKAKQNKPKLNQQKPDKIKTKYSLVFMNN